MASQFFFSIALFMQQQKKFKCHTKWKNMQSEMKTEKKIIMHICKLFSVLYELRMYEYDCKSNQPAQ